jgi:hypothetical protein
MAERAEQFPAAAADILGARTDILAAGAPERAAVLVAAVRRLADMQRQLESISARVFADRALSTFAQLDRERGALSPRAEALRSVISVLIEAGGEWRDDELISLTDALASFDSWTFTSVDYVPLEAIAELIARELERFRPSAQLVHAIAQL